MGSLALCIAKGFISFHCHIIFCGFFSQPFWLRQEKASVSLAGLASLMLTKEVSKETSKLFLSSLVKQYNVLD
jgi:hypothetical protein